MLLSIAYRDEINNKRESKLLLNGIFTKRCKIIITTLFITTNTRRVLVFSCKARPKSRYETSRHVTAPRPKDETEIYNFI